MTRNYIVRMTEAIPKVVKLGQMEEVVEHPYALQFYGYYQQRGWHKFWHRFKLLIKLGKHVN